MNYSLEDLWRQALEDDYAVSVNGKGYQSRLVYGVKIILEEETREITLFNTMRGGDYYEKIFPQELEVFNKKGWRVGVYNVALSNYRLKLNSIQDKIRNEANDKNNKNIIEYYKSYREKIIKRYNETKEKYNQLN